jgi:hypothetical protein
MDHAPIPAQAGATEMIELKSGKSLEVNLKEDAEGRDRQKRGLFYQAWAK